MWPSEAGHQVYYVLPLIEVYLEQEIENVLEVAERLADRFPDVRSTSYTVNL